MLRGRAISANKCAVLRAGRLHGSTMTLALLIIMLLAVIAITSLALPQSVSEYQVKAAYLYNFAKATPDDAFADAKSSLVMCIYGGDEGFVEQGHGLTLRDVRRRREIPTACGASAMGVGACVARGDRARGGKGDSL